ncbi:MAG: hypothetical protein HY791_12595 [Deltaproteobacteria bacterium]|nr:hypothetical protein [Deltaproteobacteria bacterium]
MKKRTLAKLIFWMTLQLVAACASAPISPNECVRSGRIWILASQKCLEPNEAEKLRTE